MATAAEIALAEQLRDLGEIAEARHWEFEQTGPTQFKLGLTARDGSEFWLLVDCDQFPAQPPAFHWYDRATGTCDVPKATPKGSGYFHGQGRICAPWNRLAYKQCDPQGPHKDWELAAWITNRRTGGTRTLAAMAIRINYELNSPRYSGRME